MNDIGSDLKYTHQNIDGSVKNNFTAPTVRSPALLAA
jgi:hypothetical protein